MKSRTEKEKENKKSELDLAVWEGRYADYLAQGLAKVKETSAWKNAYNLRGYSWVAFRSEVLSLPLTDPIAIKYRGILKAAAKEAGFTLQDVITAIDFYASRCSSRLHHAGLDQIIRKGDFGKLALQMDLDFKDLVSSTPRSRQPAIVPLQKMIKSYKDLWFATFKNNADFILTEKGKDARDAAMNRVLS